MDGLAAAIASAFGLGLRHGLDWDHLAALADITGSDDDTRRSMRASFLYIVGHGLVVAVLGMVAVTAGRTIPAWLDDAMGRVVGATLVVLGVYVVVSLIRHGRDARLRSRWSLAWEGMRRAAAIVIRHDHDHPADSHHDEHAHSDQDPNLASPPADFACQEAKFGSVGTRPTTTTTMTTHRHEHVHTGTLPEDPFTRSSGRTAFGVGILHGVGAETPTQMLLFVTAAGAGGILAGSSLVAAFVIGLMVSNTAVALLAWLGVLNAARNFAVFATVSVVVASVSIGLGLLYLVG